MDGSGVEELKITAYEALSWADISSLVVDPVARRLYVGFSGYGLGTIGGIAAGPLDGPVDQVILGGGAWRDIVDMTVDPTSGGIFYVNALDRTINRINADGSDRQTLVTDIVAGGIALWSAGGTEASRLFWIQKRPDRRIVSAELDGSDQTTVIGDLRNPSHLAIDSHAGLLFWSDPVEGTIVRARIDGSDHRIVATCTSRILGIASVSSPSAAVLVHPPALASGLPTSLSLRWGTPPIQTRSEVQVAAHGDESNVVFALNTPATDAWFDAPETESQYVWRVRLVGAGGAGPWTTWSQFSVGSAGALAAELIEPPDEAENVSVYPSFGWKAAESASRYRLQVAGTDAFSTLIVDVDTVSTTGLTVGPLENRHEYFWRVAGIGPTGAHTFTQPFSFTTVIAAPLAVALNARIQLVRTGRRLDVHAASRPRQYFLHCGDRRGCSRSLVCPDLTTRTRHAVLLEGPCFECWRCGPVVRNQAIPYRCRDLVIVG
jgi:hypothetical protein